MSALPLISHHLFVAATGQNENAERQRRKLRESEAEADMVQLEFLSVAKPAFEEGSPQLQVQHGLSGS